ncbi:hypothetical protein ABZ716_03680 [Streptomyces sp. NPDC006687]|uniref:hypothetical protein n=1 Tax=unclassified Streptomyces TaxID=2593676 RepID=UPI0033FFC61F
MTDHSAAVAAAAAHIHDLAEATSDPRNAYAGHAEIASVTAGLLGLAQHLEAALEHLARHIERHDGDWDTAEKGRRLPAQDGRAAGRRIRTAAAEAGNMARALGGSVEALGRV